MAAIRVDMCKMLLSEVGAGDECGRQTMKDQICPAYWTVLLYNYASGPWNSKALLVSSIITKLTYIVIDKGSYQKEQGQ